MAMEKYGYAETSEIKATNAGHLPHIINNDEAIENGTLWKLGEYYGVDADGNELYKVEKAAQGDEVILAHSVLLPYDTTTTLRQHEMYLRIEAGKAARGYELVKWDRYKVADYMITPIGETPAAGNLIVLNPANGRYKEVKADTDLSTYGFAARIEYIEYKSNLTLVMLFILKNEQVQVTD